MHPGPCHADSLRRRLLQAILALAAAMMCVFSSSAATAQTTDAQPGRNAILAIDATATNKHIDVRIRLREPLVRPPLHFSTLHPARIAIDLPAMDNATDKQSQDLNLHSLRSYSIAQSEERSRIVFKLTSALPYTLSAEGRSLMLRLDVSAPATKGEPLPISRPDAPLVKNIDFRRGPQGEGRIIVDLPDAATALNVRQQGKQLIAELSNAGLPASLQRSLDVADFGTPVRTIRSIQEGSAVRMLIDAEGAWEYSAYQKDTQLVIDLHTPGDKGKRSQQQYRGDKLSLQFQSVEVRAILQVIADFTGLNIITSDSVAGALSLRLKDVPWDQALDIVLQARGLDMRRNGSVIWIAPHNELLAKEKLELEQRAQIAELEPLRAEVFQLNYQKAEAFRKVFGISDDGGYGNSYGGGPERRNSILSRRGSAVVDQRTNQLFVTDTPSVLDNIRKLLEKVDIASRQVLIEARIVEADDSFSRNLGVRLGFSAKANGFAAGNSYNSVGELAGLTPATPTSYANNRAVNLPAQALGGASAGSFALSLFNAAANRFLNLELSALEADGKGKIVSSPRVVTADQQAALIEQGEEIPYQQATSSGATSTAFKKANLKLEVTPQITPDGNVILSVDINKDSRGTSTPGGLAINTKHVKTLVQVENGGTVVIGGIYTQTQSTNVAKVPLLGDIPVLGNLFKNTTRVDDKTELLIFLTPKIVMDRQFLR
ncbi:type IV pilus secretin PilQ [Herbaspirillum rhizosphaerae]|uniref:type IV pilus secretin PilQ n=1 Tax=Herbaspirillum rhizosphaerae TaxID=346179 RepID=UPI00067E0C19|nr:type IV pilus secretin PilQ family protein [Herbaspirillum rhizosphaerae]